MRSACRSAQPHPALLVIDRAIASDQGRKYVYVLDADNKVQYAADHDGCAARRRPEGDRGGAEAGRLGRRAAESCRSGRAARSNRTGCPCRRSGQPRRRAVSRRPRPGSSESPAVEKAELIEGRTAMLSQFFIDRPIFATVLSVVITLIGGIALFWLPMAQYPRITPPGVSVTINYPGASAPVVADTVAAPIEQQVNGVEGMLYMSSQMGNDGSYTLTVTFDIGTDVNTALVMVQNRVALAMPQLPPEVQNQGITIRKKTPDILMIVNFFSPDGRYDDIYLSNFATIYVKDELLRVYGVSDINYMGQRDYSIRAWLDPQKLASRSMTAMDVANAIRSENLDAPAGQIGQPPAPGYSRSSCRSIRWAGSPTRSSSERSWSRPARWIPTIPPTGIVRLRDVARMELGAQNYNQSCTFDGHQSVGLSIYQLPGTNALDVADRVRAEDGRAQDPLSGRTGLRHRLRHDPVHPRVGLRSLQDAARRGDLGRHRRARVPAGLEGHDPADDRRARLVDRHVRGHGGAWAFR